MQHARNLGFSIDEVRELVAAAEAGCCDRLLPELDRLLAAKLADRAERINEMTEFRERLGAFRWADARAGGSSFSGAV